MPIGANGNLHNFTSATPKNTKSPNLKWKSKWSSLRKCSTTEAQSNRRSAWIVVRECRSIPEGNGDDLRFGKSLKQVDQSPIIPTKLHLIWRICLPLRYGRPGRSQKKMLIANQRWAFCNSIVKGNQEAKNSLSSKVRNNPLTWAFLNFPFKRYPKTASLPTNGCSYIRSPVAL